MSAIEELRATVSRLHDILREYGEAYQARQLPTAARSRSQRMDVRPNHYLAKEDEPDLSRRFAEAQARITKDMVAEAEILRDQKLHALAADLREIRAKLPVILNLATVAIQTSALMLEHEALYGPQAAPPAPAEGIL